MSQQQVSRVNPNSKRQYAHKLFLDNLPMLAKDGKRVFRAFILNTIRAKYPETSEGSLGAIYNDAKHAAIQAGKCEPFGRYGQGRNNSSTKPMPAKMIPGARWRIVDKATQTVVGYAIKRPEAYAARTCKDTQMVEKIAA